MAVFEFNRKIINVNRFPWSVEKPEPVDPSLWMKTIGVSIALPEACTTDVTTEWSETQ